MPDCSPKWRWYVTITALRQYMQIVGYHGEAEDTNPHFRRAEHELFDLCWAAEPVAGKTTKSGASIWRVKATVRGKRARLEFTVAPEGRPEGNLQQLIRITYKG